MSARVLTSVFAAATLGALGLGTGVHGHAAVVGQAAGSGVSISGSDITVTAGFTDMLAGRAGGASSSGGPVDPCSPTYRAIDPAYAAELGPGGPGPGRWWEVATPLSCGVGQTGMAMSIPVWVPTGMAPGSAPQVLAREAVRQLHLPAPAVEMSPRTDFNQIVNFDDWLWLDRSAWHPLTATAAVGPVSVTATGTPDEVVWDMGDGHRVTCTGPGVPYDLSLPEDRQHTDCHYTWPQPSSGQPGGTFTVTTTVYWHVRWTAVGAPGGGDLGVVGGPPTTTRVHVIEIHALNVPTSR